MICESTRFANLPSCTIMCTISLLKIAHSWGQFNVLCFFTLIICLECGQDQVAPTLSSTNLNHSFWCSIVVFVILSNFMKNVGPWTNLNHAFGCVIVVYNSIQFMINFGLWINLNHVFSFGIVVFAILSNLMIIWSLKQFKPWCVLIYYYYVCNFVKFYHLLVLEII